MKRWDDYVSSHWNESKEEEGIGGSEEEVEVEGGAEWDWERWKRHFADVEEEERIVAVLKSQLRDAVIREDYEDAAKLKLAISTALKNDTVGTAISDLNRAINEERYSDAAFIRDHAGAGLVGWWAGISEDSVDPYGRIIQITAEHKRYVARSYSSRQLATGRAGLPLFEVFFTDSDGEYKQQAVLLKWQSRHSGDSAKKSAQMLDASRLNPLESSTEEGKEKYAEGAKKTEEREEDPDGLVGIQNILQDMIPGIKVKVLKVISPGKVDRDVIAKVIEQIMDEEDEGDIEELENIEVEDVGPEGDIEEIEMDAGDVPTPGIVGPGVAPTKLVIGTLMQNLPRDVSPKDKVRIPARLERRDHLSFSFFIEQDEQEADEERALRNKNAQRSAKLSADLVMSDLAKVILGKEKIPIKVLRDVGKLISSAINQNTNHESLCGTTHFNRIEIPSTSDPLSGLYVGAHGMQTSEVLHLKRKFGQWQADDETKKPMDLEFYEYVEALKITGGLSVPAGQVAFRAKIGKQYQLPHKGIIPEEFGVVARYKGQGHIAEPGFQNPRWVDGELVILDGKFVRGGPVIGFVYWAPEYHFLVFFNRLRLPE